MSEDEQPKKKRKGKPFIFVPNHIQKWARESSTNAYINNWKSGGGLPSTNGRK
jgi:hypothetical protein